MNFNAIVSSRSSTKKGGPPGESEIMLLNPQRLELILQYTEWTKLEKGTLNLEVEANVVQELKYQKPLVREPGNQVKYPERYSQIPRRRQAYLYFRGTITYNNISVDVLFRMAENPLPNRLEAFAAIHLRKKLDLADGDKVFCYIMI